MLARRNHSYGVMVTAGATDVKTGVTGQLQIQSVRLNLRDGSVVKNGELVED